MGRQEANQTFFCFLQLTWHTIPVFGWLGSARFALTPHPAVAADLHLHLGMRSAHWSVGRRGTIQFTLIPCADHSSAKACVMLTTAAFAEEYVT